MVVVHAPQWRHECNIGWKLVPLAEDHGARSAGATHHYVMDGGWDPPGTVRECGDCGKTWVGYRQDPRLGGGYVSTTTQWRPEGILARWWRTRKTGGKA